MTLVGTHSIASERVRAPGILARGRAELLAPEDAATTWPALAASALSNNPFFDPAFLVPAANALRADIEILASRGFDGQIGGLMPLTETRLGHVAPALSLWVHDYGPLGTPVVARNGAASHVASLIEAALDRAGPAKPLLLPELAVDDPVATMILAVARQAGRAVTWLDRYARAGLDRTANGIDPKAALIRKRRREYARLLRRLADIGPVRVEHAVTTEAVLARFDDYVALEGAGWKGRAGTAMANSPAIVDFARTALADLAPRGAASILTLFTGDRPAAMLICLHEGATALTWKIAYDETLSHYSPGALLMLEAPEHLFADPRVTLIDSLATPNHPMIDHLWRGRLQRGTLLIGPERRHWLTAIGRNSHRATGALRTIARNLRRRARRRSHEDAQS